MTAAYLQVDVLPRMREEVLQALRCLEDEDVDITIASVVERDDDSRSIVVTFLSEIFDFDSIRRYLTRAASQILGIVRYAFHEALNL